MRKVKTFEVKTETKLKCHNTVDDRGNVNYVPMVKCEKCAFLFKTAGLLRKLSMEYLRTQFQ